eukprot:NODE_1909_length_700_cov_41.776614_g1859_i0.p1 GENE.NODE_1909_length_700_cov_41.776614_g1859_i0~~NODE_1909_length_700_cov_41.776614_g1859_i0.p1  ORF type:complete len:161 (-),score=46.69 NODE_1909_length_700_cov_41.776614_g1859_i0:133-615(-)
MAPKVGDKLPHVQVSSTESSDPVYLDELFAGKKGVLFAIPGAFTPGCHKTHMPGYVKDYDKFKAKGVDIIACIAVNDIFVMKAFVEANNAQGKVVGLSDAGAAASKALGGDMTFEAPVFGHHRSKRYSMVVEDGVIKSFNLEPDGGGLTCSLSNVILDQL